MSLDLKQVRRALHQLAEPMFEEFETTTYLEKALLKMDLKPERILETGLVVFIDKGTPTTTAFRADIDALAQNETSNHDFKSKTPGLMHACGHDGHMSILLGFADYISQHLNALIENILLIFQPAEEGGAGAMKLLDKGIFEKYKVDRIFGMHMFPGLPEGIIASMPGPFMAQNAELYVTVKGKSAHAAMPHLGVDPIIITAGLLQKFQTIITRINSPFESSVLTFGKISGGTACNIIADQVEIVGTLRTFSQKTYDRIINTMQKMIDAEKSIYDIEIDFEVRHGYPAVVNDATLFKNLKEAIPEEQFHEFSEPFMLSEDFSYYQEKVSGLFYYLGCANEAKGYVHPLHSSQFDFDEKVLDDGVNSYILIARKLGILHD